MTVKGLTPANVHIASKIFDHKLQTIIHEEKARNPGWNNPLVEEDAGNMRRRGLMTTWPELVSYTCPL